MAKKSNTKALAQQKRQRRRWLTFVRMVRYGINNLTRNAWLTIAATAVMTITLLIILVTVVSNNVLHDSVSDLTKKVDMSIYLKSVTTEKQVNTVMDEIKNLANVDGVNYISSEEAKKQQAADNKGDANVLNAINEATNKLPATIRVSLTDINDTSSLDNYVKDSKTLKKYIDPSKEPSFSGPRRAAIQNIGRGIDFVQRAGLGASILFVVISSLIVFNTIRMAIFNRKEEINMMKLIGAEKSFIRGPFVVEAMFYGIIAAIIATAIGGAVLWFFGEKLQAYGFAIQPTIDLLTQYSWLVILGMIILGALIGIISSRLATRRYLKI